MALSDLLQLSDSSIGRKQGMSEERINEHLEDCRNLIAFFREYPDLFVDFCLAENNPNNFHFYYYQRIFLRAVMRHRYVYATFPRAYSKSFLSMMALMLRCTFYPGSHLFVTTGGKEQAASITMSKVEEICKLIPALSNEINWSRGVTKKSKDDVQYIFKNGSSLDILAAKESSRGQRRTGGLMEECILIEGQTLNEIIIPTTNVNRLLPDGTRDDKEVVNKSQIYITTAGWKNSFAYDKLVELLVQSIIDPNETMVLGGTYETPITEGLLDEDFVDQLKLSGTFNEDSFDREYNSVWSGEVENAFYSAEKFDKHRKLKVPEYTVSGRSSKSAFYIFGVDVGRLNCTTEVCVFKVTPQAQGVFNKALVNIFTYNAEHFEEQAINLKKLYYEFHPRQICLDANGLGVGLVDFMVKSQTDDHGEYYPPFGPSNDEDKIYKKFKTPDMEEDVLWLMKANAPLNTEMYAYAQSQMSSGRIDFLIDEVQARTQLLDTKKGREMSTDQRNTYLMPFVNTTMLREQMLNLVEENQGINIILKQSSRKTGKDKFSAFIYGLYYIKMEEENKRKRKKRDLSKMCLFN
jgi:hypothetical protein